jgi:hypothetical protein
MHILVIGKNKKEQEADQLLHSFRSQFWLDKHQWFVRCHWPTRSNDGSFLLYILPQIFEEFDMNTTSIFYKSTCPDDKNWSYHHVHSLTYKSLSSIDLSLPHIRFCKIRHLSVTLPLDEHFWNIVPALDQLTSLCVSSSNDDAPYYLQALIDRIPCLRSFQIQSWPFSREFFQAKKGSAKLASLGRKGPKKNLNRVGQNRPVINPLVQTAYAFSRTFLPEKRLFDH